MCKYYWTCPYCGANLDHGEQCDCEQSRNLFGDNVNNYKSVQQEGGDKSDVSRTLQHVCMHE